MLSAGLALVGGQCRTRNLQLKPCWHVQAKLEPDERRGRYQRGAGGARSREVIGLIWPCSQAQAQLVLVGAVGVISAGLALLAAARGSFQLHRKPLNREKANPKFQSLNRKQSQAQLEPGGRGGRDQRRLGAAGGGRDAV